LSVAARKRIGAIAVAAVVSALSLGGCSNSFCVGSGCTLSKEQVAKAAEKQLDKSLQSRGVPALPPVTCPDDLDKKVDATTRCYAKGSFGGSRTGTLGITVTVTSVHGSNANLHFVTDRRIHFDKG
jgi:hypothetical protein